MWLKKWMKTTVGMMIGKERYTLSSAPEVGGFAYSIEKTIWHEKGKAYPIVLIDGEPSIIAEDGYPMPLVKGASERFFEFYRKPYPGSVKEEMMLFVKGVL